MVEILERGGTTGREAAAVEGGKGYVHRSPSSSMGGTKRKLSAAAGGWKQAGGGGGGSLRSWVSGGGGGGTSSRRSTGRAGAGAGAGGLNSSEAGGDGEFTELGDASEEEERGTVVIVASPEKAAAVAEEEGGGKVRRRSLGRKLGSIGGGKWGVGTGGKRAGEEEMVEKEVGVVLIGYGEEEPREVSFKDASFRVFVSLVVSLFNCN